MGRRSPAKRANEQVKQNLTQPQIDVSTAPNATCDNCNNFAFTPAMMFKRISAIISPTGQEGLVPVEVYMCTACGHINAEFLPVPPVDPNEVEEETTEEEPSGIIISS